MRGWRRLLTGPRQMRSVWLISYADIMALLMTFFLMLYAMTQHAKPPHTQPEISGAVGRGVTEQAGDKDAATPPRRDAAMARSLPYVQGLIQAEIYQNGLAEQVTLIPDSTSQKLLLQLQGDLLFLPAQAVVTPAGRDVLRALAPTLARLNNAIEVLGHTDDAPLQPAQYQDNWDLSLARAAAVADILRTGGVSRNIVIRGFADGTMADIPTDLPPAMRQERARRVDIVINARDLTRVRSSTGLRIIP